MNDKPIDPKLLALLACPACDLRPPLALGDDRGTLDCAECGRRYPIVDGIPILLVDHATIPPKE